MLDTEALSPGQGKNGWLGFSIETKEPKTLDEIESIRLDIEDGLHRKQFHSIDRPYPTSGAKIIDVAFNQ